jgi:hypothetical protein
MTSCLKKFKIKFIDLDAGSRTRAEHCARKRVAIAGLNRQLLDLMGD